MSPQDCFSVLAGLCFIIGDIIYIRGMIQGQEQPPRVSWFILAVIGGIASDSYTSLGAGPAGLSMWCGSSMCLVIFAFALRYGRGWLERRDLLCLLGALISFGLGRLLKSPELITVCTLGINFFGCLPILDRALKTPLSMNPWPWLIWGCGNLCCLAALAQYSVILVLVQLYWISVNALTFALTARARRALPS